MTPNNHTVVIDPKDIPDECYQIGCSILYSSIRRALADPVLKADFEAWKKEREARKEAAQLEATK